MTKFSHDVEELFVLATDGDIHYSDLRGDPEIWDGTVSEFVNSKLLDSVYCVKTLGTREAAPMLQQLYDRQLKTQRPFYLKIASPGLFSAIPPHSVAVTIDMMRRLQLAGSIGGFHDMDGYDYRSYALISELDKHEGRVSEVVRARMLVHPAWRAIRFVGGADQDYAAKLLAEIIDPRWYIDPQNPDRFGQLRSRFGLTLGRGNTVTRAKQFLDSETESHEVNTVEYPPTTQAARAMLVFHAWARDLRGVPASSMSGSLPPSDFLVETYLKGALSQDEAWGLLVASQKFLKFVTGVWLDRINIRELFVPKYFFQTAEQVAAWESGTNSLDSRRN